MATKAAPMTSRRDAGRIWLAAALAAFGLLAGCGGSYSTTDSPFAPGVDRRQPAEDGVVVGNRLMAAGQHELALEAFTRAALDEGMTPEILTGIGTANLGLGRLGQSETFLRRAVKAAPDWPEAWNNLGVVLIERGKTAEAAGVFRRAYALDNGQSDAIRDNLRLALAKLENPDTLSPNEQEYTLVPRGGGSVLLTRTP